MVSGVEFGGAGGVYGGAKGNVVDLVMVLWQGVGNDVRLCGWGWKSPIIHQILYRMTEAIARIGVMTGHLVVGTENVGIMAGRWILR
jgi:hypothetical protein